MNPFTLSSAAQVLRRGFRTISLVPLLLSLVLAAGPVQAQRTRTVLFDVSIKQASLKTIIQMINRRASYDFIYSDSDISGVARQDLQMKDATVEQVLTQCLHGTRLIFEISGKTIVIRRDPKLPTPPKAEKITIEGAVQDKEGHPLPGVTVIVKGTQLGTASGPNGEFYIECPPSQHITLAFSFIGMKSREIAYTGQKFVKVVLEEDTNEVQEVVVTGMFQRKKEGYTGSATTIKGEDLKKFSKTDIARTLSAIDPGFRIAENLEMGSNPNRLPDLRMRGQATLPTGSATTSTDAVMLKGDYATYPNQPLLILDGFEITLQTMNDLDPDRVASITILKDAAATAIYGSKAANGVIVIETKAPEPGKMRVTYAGEIRVDMPDLSDYNLLNAAEKLEVERLAGYYDEEKDIEALQIYNHYLAEVKRGVNTYWLSQPLRTGVSHRHAVTLEGGDRALRYKLYAGMNNTAGVMKGSNRHTQTATLDLIYRINRFQLKNSVTVDNATGNESPYGSFREYTELNPYWRSTGENGEILKKITPPITSYSGVFESVYNPLYNATFHTLDRTTDFSIRNLFQLEYRPVDALRLVGDLSIQKNNGESQVFRPAQHTAFDGISDPERRGDFQQTQSKGFTYKVDLTASYNNVFRGRHLVSLNARMTVEESQYSSYGALVTGFPNDKMDNVLFGKKYDEKMSGSESTNRAVGWVGSFNYSYDNRYSIDFNIRADGSSQFGSDNRFAPFWSAGVKWNIREEKFMQRAEFLSDLILRASYGTTGTQGFAPYQAQQLYTYGLLLKPYLASDATGAGLVGLGNPDLKWQQTAQTNFALEAGFLKGRITTRVEYFRKADQERSDRHFAGSVGRLCHHLRKPRHRSGSQGCGDDAFVHPLPQRSPRRPMGRSCLNGSHNTDKLGEDLAGPASHERTECRPADRCPAAALRGRPVAQPHLGRPLAGDRPGQRTGGLRKTHYGRILPECGVADDLTSPTVTRSRSWRETSTACSPTAVGASR